MEEALSRNEVRSARTAIALRVRDLPASVGGAARSPRLHRHSFRVPDSQSRQPTSSPLRAPMPHSLHRHLPSPHSFPCQGHGREGRREGHFHPWHSLHSSVGLRGSRKISCATPSLSFPRSSSVFLLIYLALALSPRRIPLMLLLPPPRPHTDLPRRSSSSSSGDPERSATQRWKVF